MSKFVIVSFAFLGWFFWELSGGSDFEPKSRAQVAEKTSLKEIEDAPVVARSALSVPLVKATAPAPGLSTRAQPAVLSEEKIQVLAPPAREEATVVVASLATGLESFATPGTSALIQPSADALVPSGTNAALIVPEKPADMRLVRGSRVNMRGGPGTSFNVLIVLPKDREVEVLSQNGSGWVKLRDTETGRVGWMAAKMLTAPVANATN